MNDWWTETFSFWHEGAAALLAPVITVAVILILAVLSYLALTQVVARLAMVFASRMRFRWFDTVQRRGIFRGVSALAPGLLARTLSGLWLSPESAWSRGLLLCANLWLLLAGLLVVYAALDVASEMYNKQKFARQMPIRGFVQAVKIVILIVILIIALAMLMGKSPGLLVSGMGAMTAVLMLVFKDPILGFMAGIQLSANRMLAVGDWLEMPKYQADGDVIEVTLTTVKVRNWDQTITTVPTYALISDSFKNWRGMQESGGRRIMRSLFIDMQSVHFMSPEEIDKLRKAQLISAYIEQKLTDIERDNRERRIDPASPINGRHLTNLGTFRAYLREYIKSHPGIHPNLIMMVRQLQPTPEGLPMEIYAFTRETAWPLYEGIQADIFDHILAVVPEFGLRVFQAPSGRDVQGLMGAIKHG